MRDMALALRPKEYGSRLVCWMSLKKILAEYAGKRVLVTGGAGCIGSNLVDALMSRGCEVVVVDNLSSGRLENLEGWMGDSRFSFVRGDLVKVGEVEGWKGEFVFTSSTVYGEAETPTCEGCFLRPISVYGGSKLACEGLISSYAHSYGFLVDVGGIPFIFGSFCWIHADFVAFVWVFYMDSAGLVAHIGSSPSSRQPHNCSRSRSLSSLFKA